MCGGRAMNKRSCAARDIPISARLDLDDGRYTIRSNLPFRSTSTSKDHIMEAFESYASASGFEVRWNHESNKDNKR